MTFVAGVVFFSTFLQSQVTSAAIKDTDLDSLTDESESSLYHTDPAVFDTDGDGVGDGSEIVSGTSPLDPRSSRLSDLVRPDVGIMGNKDQWSWYFGRVTGLLAFVLLTFGAMYGLVMSSRVFQRVISGAAAYELHRTLSWVSLGAVVLHVGSFFFDDFLRIRFIEAIVPGVLTRDFPSALGFDMGLAVAFGIVALYFMIILLLTSEFRAKLSQRAWRRTHYLSFLAYAAFVAHGFMAGSDSGELWVRGMYIVSSTSVLLLVAIRIVSRTLLLKRQAFSENRIPSENPPSVS